jgi:hypothetical protein
MVTFLIFVVLFIILSTFAVIRRALSSTLSTKILPLPAAGLDPNWVVGFVDAPRRHGYLFLFCYITVSR